MKLEKINEKIKEQNLNNVGHNKLKTNVNGISLIILVVIIIVLLIIASVGISLVLGKNETSKEDISKGTLKENVSKETAIKNNTSKEKSEVEKYRDSGTYMTKATNIKDSDGNIIKVPEGFKIAKDSGKNVTEGIVIEDNDVIQGIGNNRGNQYVWIPVGTGIKKSDGTSINIILGRYDFANGIREKAKDGKTPLSKGTPILIQSIDDYTKQTEDIIIDNYYYENITQREGTASEGLDGLNATALSILDFKTSVEKNKGYYIARYEASYGTDGKANSKVSNGFNDSKELPTQEGYLWNNISQIDAAKASREIYGNKVTTDLINSYAWDTAIVYMQAFSGDTDYSYQDGKSINDSLQNTGVNKDELCKINDMASNTREWTTECSTYVVESNAHPCTDRGGIFYNARDYTTYRGIFSATYSFKNITFRSILYI